MRYRSPTQPLQTAGLSRADIVGWRWASASVIGTAHLHKGVRLQDAYTVSRIGKGGLLAIVSDGAGSAAYGAQGAWLTCRVLSLRFREWMKERSELPSDDDMADWVDELRDLIATVAARRETTPRQFAATLAAVAVTPSQTVTLHVGDSAVAARDAERWDILCWPENGEYASSTYFVTDDPQPRLNIARHGARYNAFALFSDGVGDLALAHLEEVAHRPFLDPMIRPVDAATGQGRLVQLSGKLATYLAGAAVCERTDDDKTLVLVSGR